MFICKNNAVGHFFSVYLYYKNQKCAKEFLYKKEILDDNDSFCKGDNGHRMWIKEVCDIHKILTVLQCTC